VTYIKFFNTYSIEEIANRTHISPVVVNAIKEKKFKKFEAHKFYGFIQIIEREYNISLEELTNEFNEYLDSIKPEQEEIEVVKESSNKNGYILVFILVIMIGIIIYYMKNDGKLSKDVVETSNDKNFSSLVVDDNDTNISFENNNTALIEEIVVENNITEENVYEVFTIIPEQKLWFYVYSLDDKKSKEYLTSENVELNISKNQYIKFGHGLFTISFKDENITPNTKDIIRYIVEDGHISKTDRIKSYE
jgi:hypothetical protein